MQSIILAGLFVCHWMADYTHLSCSWMLSAKRLGKPLFPILVHGFVHAFLMTLFLLLIGVSVYKLDVLFGIQMLSHFLIDLWKGRMNGWFPSLQLPTNKWHWIIFGLDQLLHSLVIVWMSSYVLI